MVASGDDIEAVCQIVSDILKEGLGQDSATTSADKNGKTLSACAELVGVATLATPTYVSSVVTSNITSRADPINVRTRMHSVFTFL